MAKAGTFIVLDDHQTLTTSTATTFTLPTGSWDTGGRKTGKIRVRRDSNTTANLYFVKKGSGDVESATVYSAADGSVFEDGPYAKGQLPDLYVDGSGSFCLQYAFVGSE